MDSTQHIQRVPDWDWPRRRHLELEAIADVIAEEAQDARATIIEHLAASS